MKRFFNKMALRVMIVVFGIRSTRTCRVCGKDARRLKRKLLHRLISKSIPVVYVSCCNKRFLVVSKSGEI